MTRQPVPSKSIIEGLLKKTKKHVGIADRQAKTAPKPKPAPKLWPDDNRLHADKMRALNLKIRAALRQYYNDPTLTLPTKEIGVNQTHKLDWDDVTNGVVAMIGAMNLYSGSSGTFELYRLNLAYLHDYDLRAEINALIEARRPNLPTFR